MISRFSITLVFLVLYPILPTYFFVAGMSTVFILEVLYSIVMIGTAGGKISTLKTNALTVEMGLFLFVFFTVLSDFMHSESMPAIRFLFSVPIIGMVIVNEVNTEEKFIKAIEAIISCACFVAVFGIVESVTGFNIFTLLNTANVTLAEQFRLGLLRAKSFTYQSNSFGNYLMMVSALCVYRINISKTRRDMKRWSYRYALICVSIIFTVSRGSIVLFLLCQIFLWAKLGLKNLVKKMVILLGAIFLVYFVSTVLMNKSTDLFSNFLYTILSVFDDSMVDNISGTSTGVASAEGHRLLLYGWVWESIKNNLWFGKGSAATLNYKYYVGDMTYGYYETKTSIEVEILNCLFRYGIMCMIAKVFYYLSILRTAFSRNNSGYGKKKLNFGMSCAISFAVYFISMFSVAQDTESRIFYVIVFLFLAYRKYEFCIESDEIS